MAYKIRVILDVEQDVVAKSQQIIAIKKLIAESGPDEMIDEKVDLIQLKSGFLDLMQAGPLRHRCPYRSITQLPSL